MFESRRARVMAKIIHFMRRDLIDVTKTIRMDF